MPSGIGASFKLDNPTVLTEIAIYLDGITPSNDTDQNDETTFQPGVAGPKKKFTPGFSTTKYEFSGKWSEAADAFFAAVNGMTGLDYQYGPLGTGTGRVKKTGVGSLYGYTGPVATLDGLTFSATLTVDSETTGVF